MPLLVARLAEATRDLYQPFVVRPLASLGSLSASVFVCQGQMEWHKHLDEEELFLTVEGVVSLDSDRGEINLHAEELVVVPKGVLHRSRSMLRSVVVLIRPAVMTERTNGHRHYYTTGAEPALEKVRLAPTLAGAPGPFQPVVLGQVGELEVLGLAGQGLGPVVTAAAPGALWLVVRGELRLETDTDVTVLGPGDLTVAPAGAPQRLVCREPSLLLQVASPLP